MSRELEESIARDALRKRCLEYRAKHHLTQRQLAQLCDCERGVIIKIENRRNCAQLSQIKVWRIISDGMLSL